MSVEFPLVSVLLIYIVYLTIFLIFSFFNIHHLLHHGFAGKGVHIILTLYIILSLLTVLLTYLFLADIDWQRSIPLFSEKYKIIDLK
ncbi:MAG: hypothetical protein ACOZBH_00510 [Patescibacteria group bacterium]